MEQFDIKSLIAHLIELNKALEDLLGKINHELGEVEVESGFNFSEAMTKKAFEDQWIFDDLEFRKN
jgi:hypothetical protein